MTENDQHLFSEDGALRELEELQQKIEASRARRKEANEAFDRFLRSFDRPSAPSPMKGPPPAPRAVAAPPPPSPFAPARPEPPSGFPPLPGPVATAAVPLPTAPVVPPQEPEVQYLLQPAPAPVPSPTVPAEIASGPVAQAPEKIELPPPVFPPELSSKGPDTLDLDDWDRTSTSGVDAFPEEARMGTVGATDPLPLERRPVPAALAGPGRSGKRIPSAAIVVAVLAIAAAAFFALRETGDDSTTQAGPVAVETPAAPRAAPPPAPPPVAAPSPRAEISTLRQVWIRVTVDGRTVIEREFPPATRIPLDPASRFVIRAGDAGAVRVAIGGKDQGAVGLDGRVATKAFTVPPKAVQ